MVPAIATVSFTADLAMSLDYVNEDRRLLAEEFGVPVANVHKTGSFLDKRGIDYFVRLPTGRVTVDVKRRRRAYWASHGNPDLTLEIETSGRPGPLFRDSPLPDFLGFAFNDVDGLWLVPAQALRESCKANLDEWVARYGLRHSKPTQWANGVYTSSAFVAVPADVVVASLSAQPYLGI